MTNKFKRGDYVDRINGSYSFPAIVLSTYDNMGTEMCDVRLAGFRVIHIFPASALKKISIKTFTKFDQTICQMIDKELNDVKA